MSEALTTNTTLTKLYLGSGQYQHQSEKRGNNANRSGKKGNGVSAKGADSLSEALKANTTLETLDLGGVQS